MIYKVRTILGAIPSRLEAEQFPQPDDAPPVFYSQEDESFMQDFKCYHQTPDKDPTSSSNRTLLRLMLQGDSDDDSSSDGNDSYRETAEYSRGAAFFADLRIAPPTTALVPAL